MTANELAMTGYNFFSVTRTFMLTVSKINFKFYLYNNYQLKSITIFICILLFFFKIAGTIVTYEIVLIQFNSVSNEMVNQNNTLLDCP